MWDLPGPGIEPMSPALAGGFLSTVPPGKPFHAFLMGSCDLSIGGFGSGGWYVQLSISHLWELMGRVEEKVEMISCHILYRDKK